MPVDLTGVGVRPSPHRAAPLGDGVDILRGCSAHPPPRDELVTETITDREAWFDALADVCGLPLQLGAADREVLWASVVTGHDGWLESQEH